MLELQRQRALRLLRNGVQDLAGDLSVSGRIRPASDDLLEWIDARSTAHPALVAGISPLIAGEPYRIASTIIDAQLEATERSAPADGAYGLWLQVDSDQDGLAKSDDFIILFNFHDNGLSEELFEEGVDAAAGVLIPEPSTGGLLLLGLTMVGAAFGRRRSAHRSRK